MIAKIVPRKGRGVAGASALLDYIERDGVEGGERVAAGFDAAGNLIEYAVRGRAAEIEALAQADDRRHYISRAPRVDVATGEVEVLEYPIETHGVLSLETAALEFQGVSNESRRTKNPYLHVVVSWRDGEEPTNAEVFASGRHVLEALGLGQHQYVIAIHRDTGNVHAHLAANRVHPETYRAQHLSMSYAKIDRSLRELEVRYGWERDRGLHEIRERDDREPEVIPRLRRERESARVAARAQTMRAWSGDRPFTEWVREAAPTLRTVLGRPGAGWAAVHSALAEFNLELREKGSGFMVVDRTDPTLMAKASHIGRFASRDRLESALGAFQSKAVAQLRLVARRGCLRFQLTLDAMNLVGTQRHLVQQRFASHTVVALGVAGRNASLVHPKEVEPIPRHAPAPRLTGVGEQLEGGFGSGPTADGYARASAGFDGFASHLDKILRRTPRQRSGIRFHIVLDLELSCHKSRGPLVSRLHA